MKKVLAIIIVLFIIIGTGCVERKSGITVSDNRNKGYLVYSMGEIPEDLYMLQDKELRKRDLLVNLFEGLVKLDDENKIEPGIAESWSVSKDGLTYSFRLKDTAKWSDGSSIKAEDFVEFFASILNKKTDNIYAEELYSIFGAEEYRKGTREFESVAVRAVEDNTLQIRLNYPCPYLLTILAQPEFTLRKLDRNLQNYLSDYKNIKYSGPFKIEDISGKSKITLVKNPSYWNKENVNSSKLILTFSGAPENTLVEFERGKIDIFVNPPLSEVDRLLQEGELKIVPNWSTRVLTFNLNSKAIGSDIDFRKAINYALNRSEITEEVLAGTEKPAASIVSSSLRSISTNRRPPSYFNKSSFEDKAKSLVEEMKLKPKALVLIFENDTVNKKVSEEAAKSISSVLGMKCMAKGLNHKDFIDAMKAGNYDIALTDINGSYGDSTAVISSFLSVSPSNNMNFKNAEFDLTYSKIKFERDNSKRLQLIDSCEQLLVEGYYVLPISFSSTVLCSQSYIEGLIVTQRGNIRLDRAYVSLYGN